MGKLSSHPGCRIVVEDARGTGGYSLGIDNFACLDGDRFSRLCDCGSEDNPSVEGIPSCLIMQRLRCKCMAEMIKI